MLRKRLEGRKEKPAALTLQASNGAELVPKVGCPKGNQGENWGRDLLLQGVTPKIILGRRGGTEALGKTSNLDHTTQSVIAGKAVSQGAGGRLRGRATSFSTGDGSPVG